MISFSMTPFITMIPISQCSYTIKTKQKQLWATHIGSFYQDANSNRCVLIIQFYRYFSTLNLLFYCIASPRLCLYPLPSCPPLNTKLNKMAIVDENNTIIWFYLLILQYIIMYCSFSNSIIAITDPCITKKAANTNLWIYQTEKADVRERNTLVPEAANLSRLCEKGTTTVEPAIRHNEVRVVQAVRPASSDQEWVSKCGES